MIDMRYKPYFLPQVNAPEDYMINKLQGDGIDVEQVEVDPNELNPMQGIVFSSEVDDFDTDDMDNIWISKDNDVVDGHHRLLKCLMKKCPIACNRVGLNGKDTARVLNKYQDIYEYEQQRELEEVVNQEVINAYNDMSSEESTNEFLASLEETEMPDGNACTIVAYREKPIMENSVIGNFFLLNPMDGYDKYEIDFENLLDTNDLGLQFGKEHPVDMLAKTWFPNVDFEKASAPFTHSPQEFMNRAVVERAQKMGYDGIKYGDLMVQGLK